MAGLSSQVKLKLTTQQKDIALPDGTPPILVNTNFSRLELSTLVNNLLENEKPVPFEFLINGAFLRTPIEEYLTANGISAESLLTVEYVRAIVPPTHVTSFEHDDWVSSVDVLSLTSRAGLAKGTQTPLRGQERILSGSYDGFVRIWNMSGQVAAISPGPNEGGHTAGIKSVKFIDSTHAASAGHDRSIRIWRIEDDGSKLETTVNFIPELELCGHKWGINAIDIHNSSSRLLSGSDDWTLGVWSTQKSGAPAAPEVLLPQTSRLSKKRRKVSSSQVPQKGCLSQLKGHTGSVSDTIFAPNDHTVAYSASQDHTLRTWDIPTGSLVDTRTTMNPLCSIEAIPDLNLVAVGNSARFITLVDPRASATTTSVMTLRGHTNQVVTLSRDPGNKHGLLSGSHDGTCRIWDLRSTKNSADGTVSESIYTLPRRWLKIGEKRVAGEGVKVFSSVWDKEVGIVSGSEDKKVQIDRGTSTIPT